MSRPPSHSPRSRVAPNWFGAIALLLCAAGRLGGTAQAESATPFAPPDHWLTLGRGDQIVLTSGTSPRADHPSPAEQAGSLSFKPETETPPAPLQFQGPSDTSRYISIAQWTAAVLLLSGAAVVGLKRWTGTMKGTVTSTRRLSLLETLSLGPRGAVSLVQCDGRLALIGCDAQGIKTISFCPVSFQEEIGIDEVSASAPLAEAAENGAPYDTARPGFSGGTLPLQSGRRPPGAERPHQHRVHGGPGQ